MILIKNLRMVILTLFVGICLNSCASITPIPEERETIAFEGNEDNAGIVGFLDNGSLEITPKARDRYNDLILKVKGMVKYLSYKDSELTALPNGNWSITKGGAEFWRSLILEDEQQRINK